MISVLLYGRNDSHGYNLHKRAAISLNCIAHVLNHMDDEIIFVDYNTPDDMPTFVEAIQDTLTDKAKRLIRVLRIRPEIHERFKHKTHLVALESVSRNAAARRANPANPWLLSTNTDMVFVPRDSSRSLSGIVAGLADGFYHLPRFELPECLWESMNRLDPEGIIRATRDWGVRFHLNDVVYMNDVVIYDGPGDFQLMLRDDLFSINGFHEEMLRGWHVDSNLAKRMKLRRGEVKSALPLLYGYHCDHTRQSTVLHGRGRVENDMYRFFFDVDRAEVPEQQDSWGLRGEFLEEFRLSDASFQPYLRALEQVLPGGTKPFMESRYSGRGLTDLDYDPEHVLPYLCDLLSTTPRQWNLAYAGCRNDAFALFAAAAEKMGFEGSILIPDSFDWLKPSLALKIAIDRVPFERWFEAGQQFIFEFGTAESALPSGPPGETAAPVWASSDKLYLGSTALTYQRMVQRERIVQPTASQRPRRVLVVNTIVNAFDALVSDNMSFTYTPYSSRIRHGYVIVGDEKPRVPMTRSRPAEGDPGVPPPEAGRHTQADQRDDSISPSGICDRRDWQDEAWLAWARRFFGGQIAAATHQRGLDIWERARLLRGLDDLGLCAADKHVLTVERIPDAAMIAALSDRDCSSSMVEISTFFPGDGEVLSAHGAERRPLERYDTILLPRSAVTDMGGMTGLPKLLKRAADLLVAGGVLAFAAEICVDGIADALCMDPALIADGKFAELISAHTGMEVLGSVEKGAAATGSERDDLAVRRGGALISASAWFLRKKTTASEADWSRFLSALQAHQSDSVMNLLYKMSIGSREADGIHVAKSEPPGIWVYGPYIKLPGGFYRATVICDASEMPGPRSSVSEIDVILGPDHCATVKTVTAGEFAAGPVEIGFEVPARLAAETGGSYPLEIRLRHKGNANLHLRDIRLASTAMEETLEPQGAVTTIVRSILDPVRRWQSGLRSKRAR